MSTCTLHQGISGHRTPCHAFIVYTWTQHVICSPCKTDLATACRFMSHPWTLIDMPCLYTSCSSGSRARVAEYVRARLTLSTKACLATMPETPHGYFGPEQISGTLTAQDREAIWRQTECFASVRARKNTPRVLTIHGPTDKLPEARVMALRFIDANEVAQDLPPGGQPFAGSKERWCAGQRRRLEVEKHRLQQRAGRSNSGQQQHERPQEQPRPKASRSPKRRRRSQEQASSSPTKPAVRTKPKWIRKDEVDAPAKASLAGHDRLAKQAAKAEACPATSFDMDPLTIVSFETDHVGSFGNKLPIEQVLHERGYDSATTCIVDCSVFKKRLHEVFKTCYEINHNGEHTVFMRDMIQKERATLQLVFQEAKTGLQEKRINQVVCLCNNGQYRSVAVARLLREALNRSGRRVHIHHHHRRGGWGFNGCGVTELCYNCAYNYDKENLYREAYEIFRTV